MGKKGMMAFWRLGAVLLLIGRTAFAQPAGSPAGGIISPPVVSPPVHDPVMIRQDSTYYVFCTGRGIAEWSSTDRVHWTALPPVFSSPPAWTMAAVRGFSGHFWAPDISFHNGRYYLYYAVSAFGKNTSAIGVAVNKTLDPRAAGYGWVDMGKVVQSVPGRDMWNAIDPNLMVDDAGGGWLTFGSFWDGIKLVRMDSSLCRIAEPEQWFTIASRSRNPVLPDTAAGDAAIEAPFICKKDNYYYLFVSWDYCCRGEKSTYKMVVGRSSAIQGPYLDRDGVQMVLGGGSLVLEGDKDWNGVGHCAVVSFPDGDWLVFHGYDANDHGRSKLRIERLEWVGGWPVVVRR